MTLRMFTVIFDVFSAQGKYVYLMEIMIFFYKKHRFRSILGGETNTFPKVFDYFFDSKFSDFHQSTTWKR